MPRFARFILIPLLAILIPLQAAAENDPPALSDGEIRQLLAPVALYPDALLSQILIASTYPLEVVEAARWVRANPGIKGQEAVAAVEDRDWDLSIKSLVAFPEVIERMSVELDWTRRLGDAFLMQEDEVMTAIQDLRERAEAAGALDELEHTRARRDGDVIVIEPANPQVVYVPYYTPQVVYGGWGWPDYPPYYWYPPGVVTTAGFYWGGGVLVTSGFWFSHFDWRHHYIVIRSPYRHHFRYVEPRWRHDPYHRRGVVYRQPVLNRQFGRSPSSPTTAPTEQTRRPALQRHHGSWTGPGDRRTTTTRSTDSRDGSDSRRAGSRTQIPARQGSLGRTTQDSSARTETRTRQTQSDQPATSGGATFPRSGSLQQRSPPARSTDAPRREFTRGTHSRSSGSDTRRSQTRSTTQSFSSDGGGSRSTGGGGGGGGSSPRGSALGR